MINQFSIFYLRHSYTGHRQWIISSAQGRSRFQRITAISTYFYICRNTQDSVITDFQRQIVRPQSINHNQIVRKHTHLTGSRNFLSIRPTIIGHVPVASNHTERYFNLRKAEDQFLCSWRNFDFRTPGSLVGRGSHIKLQHIVVRIVRISQPSGSLFRHVHTIRGVGLETEIELTALVSAAVIQVMFIQNGDRSSLYHRHIDRACSCRNGDQGNTAGHLRRGGYRHMYHIAFHSGCTPFLVWFSGYGFRGTHGDGTFSAGRREINAVSRNDLQWAGDGFLIATWHPQGA